MEKVKIAEIYKILSQTYPIFSENENDWSGNGLDSTPFKSLISVMLSTMTNSKRVVRACVALFAEISTPEELLKLDDDYLKELIKPVAHYNRKTKHLKEMCKQLLERHDGQVPGNREDLLALTGVGLKCADIMMNFTFGGDSIAIDTHVHRVLNRTGMVETKTAEETSVKVTNITPLEYRKHAHEWLIQHGMQICVARTPKCSECSILGLCEFKSKIC